MTESGLFLTHIFYQEYLKRHYLYFIDGSVAQRESKRLKLAMSGVRFPPLPFRESKFDSLQSQSVAVTAELALRVPPRPYKANLYKTPALKFDMKKEEGMKDNSFGVVGIVLGILGIIFSSANGIILGVIGLIFSMKQKKIMKNKWSSVGVILNIIAIILGVIVFVYALNSLISNPDFLSQFQQVANAK